MSAKNPVKSAYDKGWSVKSWDAEPSFNTDKERRAFAAGVEDKQKYEGGKQKAKSEGWAAFKAT